MQLSKLGVQHSGSAGQSVEQRAALLLELVDAVFVLFSEVFVNVLLNVANAEQFVEGFESACHYVELLSEFLSI